jgi:hypothetical protein
MIILWFIDCAFCVKYARLDMGENEDTVFVSSDTGTKELMTMPYSDFV